MFRVIFQVIYRTVRVLTQRGGLNGTRTTGQVNHESSIDQAIPLICAQAHDGWSMISNGWAMIRLRQMSWRLVRISSYLVRQAHTSLLILPKRQPYFFGNFEYSVPFRQLSLLSGEYEYETDDVQGNIRAIASSMIECDSCTQSVCSLARLMISLRWQLDRPRASRVSMLNFSAEGESKPKTIRQGWTKCANVQFLCLGTNVNVTGSESGDARWAVAAPIRQCSSKQSYTGTASVHTNRPTNQSTNVLDYPCRQWIKISDCARVCGLVSVGHDSWHSSQALINSFDSSLSGERGLRCRAYMTAREQVAQTIRHLDKRLLTRWSIERMLIRHNTHSQSIHWNTIQHKQPLEHQSRYINNHSMNFYSSNWKTHFTLEMTIQC